MNRRRSLLLSLPTLLAVAVVLAAGTAQAASAPAGPTLKTAVGRSTPLASALVGSQPLKPVITPRVAAHGYDRNAVATGVAAEETVPLYRAVSPGEFNDAVDSQLFRAGPNSMEGKWFADRPSDALRWGKKFYGDDPFHVVETRVPKSYADSLFANPSLDGIGSARYAEDLSVPSIGLTTGSGSTDREGLGLHPRRHWKLALADSRRRRTCSPATWTDLPPATRLSRSS